MCIEWNHPLLLRLWGFAGMPSLPVSCGYRNAGEPQLQLSGQTEDARSLGPTAKRFSPITHNWQASSPPPVRESNCQTTAFSFIHQSAFGLILVGD